MICSKALEAPVIGRFAKHSYIDDTGRNDCLGAGMAGNYAVTDLVSGNFLRGCAAKTDHSPDPRGKTPLMKPCNPKPGVTDVSACLRAAGFGFGPPGDVVPRDERQPPVLRLEPGCSALVALPRGTVAVVLEPFALDTDATRTAREVDPVAAHLDLALELRQCRGPEEPSKLHFEPVLQRRPLWLLVRDQLSYRRPRPCSTMPSAISI
jgi:hypothetical protein